MTPLCLTPAESKAKGRSRGAPITDELSRGLQPPGGFCDILPAWTSHPIHLQGGTAPRQEASMGGVNPCLGLSSWLPGKVGTDSTLPKRLSHADGQTPRGFLQVKHNEKGFS